MKVSQVVAANKALRRKRYRLKYKSLRSFKRSFIVYNTPPLLGYTPLTGSILGGGFSVPNTDIKTSDLAVSDSVLLPNPQVTSSPKTESNNFFIIALLIILSFIFLSKR